MLANESFLTNGVSSFLPDTFITYGNAIGGGAEGGPEPPDEEEEDACAITAADDADD